MVTSEPDLARGKIPIRHGQRRRHPREGDPSSTGLRASSFACCWEHRGFSPCRRPWRTSRGTSSSSIRTIGWCQATSRSTTGWSPRSRARLTGPCSSSRNSSTGPSSAARRTRPRSRRTCARNTLHVRRMRLSPCPRKRSTSWFATAWSCSRACHWSMRSSRSRCCARIQRSARTWSASPSSTISRGPSSRRCSGIRRRAGSWSSPAHPIAIASAKHAFVAKSRPSQAT